MTGFSRKARPRLIVAGTVGSNMEHYRTPNNSAGAIGLFAAIVATGARWLSIAHSCLKLECQPPMGARRSAGARSHRQRTAGHLRAPATRRPEDRPFAVSMIFRSPNLPIARMWRRPLRRLGDGTNDYYAGPSVLGRLKTRAQSLAGLRPISFTGSFSRWRRIHVAGVGALGAWLRKSSSASASLM